MLKEEDYDLTTPKENSYENVKNGISKGTTTYIAGYDEFWTWKSKTVNIPTGYANEGKGTWIKQLALIKSLEEGKKTVLFIPEDYPTYDVYDDLIHTISGKSTNVDSSNFISEEDYNYYKGLIEDLFVIIEIDPLKADIHNILQIVEDLNDDNEVGCLIIDPHSKVKRHKGAPERDDLYGDQFTSILSYFAKTQDLVIFLVMHQQTPKKQESTNNYPEPDGYGIKQGGAYVMGADSVHIIWRNNYGSDKSDTTVTVGTKKVKMQKYVGIPGTMTIKFDQMKNRYTYTDGSPLYDWDKWQRK